MRPILFVDNQDSFVWNLVDYVSVFYEDTTVRSNDIRLAEVEELDPIGIVISPGPGHPAKPRDIGSCLEIILHFPDTPILGVCLGHQAMNLAYGGTISHTRPLHGKTSEIRARWTGHLPGTGESLARGALPLAGGRKACPGSGGRGLYPGGSGDGHQAQNPSTLWSPVPSRVSANAVWKEDHPATGSRTWWDASPD